jgi:hypothetical protein
VRPGQSRRQSRQEEEARELAVIEAAEEFLNKVIKDNLSLYDCLRQKTEGQLGFQPNLSSLYTCDNEQTMASQDCKVSTSNLSSGKAVIMLYDCYHVKSILACDFSLTTVLLTFPKVFFLIVTELPFVSRFPRNAGSLGFQ